MKKKIFIPFLLLPVFLFQNCIQKITEALSEPLDNHAKYIFNDLDAEKWIAVSPKKEVYKVGDTVSITYKIPSKIGKYAEASFSTEQNIKRLFKKDYKDFDIYEDTKQGDFSVNGLGLICNSRFLNCERDKGSPKKDLIVILNGKEVKDGEERKFFVYNSKSKEYITDLKLIFLKPKVFYWKTEFSSVFTPKAFDLLPVVNTKLVNVKNKYEYNTLFIKYTESEKIAFKVVE